MIKTTVFWEKYFKELKAIDSINILFIGKDPYPKGPNGIPFCKDNIEDLRKPNCSGKYLLYSLGINVDKEIRSPLDIFFDLLKRNKIGCINASYFPFKKKERTNKKIEYSESLNSQLFGKSKQIIVAKSAIEILKKYKNYEELKDNIIEVYHPDHRNSINQHKIVRDDWNAIYSKFNGLNILLEKKINLK